jgi:ubiquinone/menaquinone biosynthesis C-methylase UbiE
VIDLCSGDSWFTPQIARIVRRVIAIHIDSDLLHLARLRLTESGVTNCEFRLGYDICRLWPHRVDFVFLANAFHGVPERVRLSQAVREVLKPSGRFGIINWQRRPREAPIVLGEPRGPRTELRLSLNETVASVQAADLKLVRIVEIPPYHYAAIFERPPF